MKVLVVGGSGFLGRRLLGSLQHLGVKAIPATRDSVQGVYLDVCDAEQCRHILWQGGFDVVVNLAATGISVGPGWKSALEANVVGSANLAQAAILMGSDAPMLVHLASSTERPNSDGNYESDYARSKADGTDAFKKLVQDHDLNARIVSIHNTYGPGQPANRFMMSSMIALKQGIIPDLRFPRRVRDFVYVEDVQQHLTTLISRRNNGVTHHELGSGVGTSLWEVIQTIAENCRVSLPEGASSVAGGLDSFAERIADPQGHDLMRCETSVREGICRTMSELP